MELFRGALGAGADQALEVAVAHAMLRRVSRGESGPALRVYQPSTRVVAFGRRDSLLPGFPAAVRAVREAGFTPVLRAPGGRAVAYTERSLVVDHVGPDPGYLAGMDERFVGYAELWAGVLKDHGVGAQVGAVPGEYCPGAHSVNARGRVKLVGTAQRLVRGAWLFSAVAIFDDAEVLRPVLSEVYRHLELPFDDDSVGSVRAEAPGLCLDTFEAAVIGAYDERFGLAPAPLHEDLLAKAQDLADGHRIADASPTGR
ncbi:lipoate--protein ligase family protein [Saccharopolyspora sp. K220]|uniref:lipoyl protein ligase domain-containing protein n=1 Tax=Saccharopolyspora soli TaxID=2926618 RepID=UPI001F59BEAB|nr:lipoate--protein ligase family protein [Saccharopolyspora soli]MCI2422407.1 lipoate--protein ligase family protein [Saccharopolyspora soli]